MNNANPFDKIITDIADYVCDYQIDSQLAYDTAYYDVLDSTACGLMALQYPACTKLLGPVVPGATMQNAARVFATEYELDPVQATFNIGAMIRWLDFNDTWLAAEWGHPSDNLATILALGDYLNRAHNKTFTMQDACGYLIKAHEIQGVLALDNSFNRVGLDHVLLVKVASTAIATHMLGGDKQTICNAVSNAWLDGQSLRTYRHAPNAGSRKSWAAGDAASRAVRLALIAMTGEMGYPSALSTKTWGFYDVSFKGNEFSLQRPYGSYVMENILFKISYPAEFHSQTAVECAIELHEQVKDRINDIDHITIRTHEAAMRIISKQGPLKNPAARDHCLEYMVAIALIFGDLTAEHYEDNVAADPRIDALREKMRVNEFKDFSRDYLDPEKRSIANAVQIFFKDGSSTEELAIEYPIGHKRRREDGIPLLLDKYEKALLQHYSAEQAQKILKISSDRNQFNNLKIDDWISALI